jgi:hypothetical protein
MMWMQAVGAASAAVLVLFVNGWTTPNNYGGRCPANITVNGMVAGGSPGSTVQYTVSYLDPLANTPVTLPPKDATFDVNGALRISAPISVSGGNSWVKISVRQGVSGSASTVTPFSIVCTSL